MNLLALGTAVALVTLLAVAFAIIFIMRKFNWELHTEIRSLRNEINQSQNRIISAVQQGAQESGNACALASLNFDFPVFAGGWSIDAFLARWLIQHIQLHQPRCIVEIGSGSSTIIIAKVLKILDYQDTEHIAVDHESQYLNLTKRIANLNGVIDRTQFLDCPLVEYQEYGKKWYGDLRTKLGGRRIDLLLIDGPPAVVDPSARLPALFELRGLLSDQCTVVLDDASRPGEWDIAQQWAKEIPGFNLTRFCEGHGFAILSKDT